ncbi:glutathione S-transferase 1-like [Lingula anatina]|uniref:Glutathione S-transferase 1-like n=1 Tax=Lingula anatina TaxID=7574 RepID=A0A1S3IGD7_LINAN|nr:glutathione S-transferase 1-like [Lingula anatina]|eukprot:XP_013396534.1 glutathione S-transferase 1-like [Lingula anatina]
MGCNNSKGTTASDPKTTPAPRKDTKPAPAATPAQSQDAPQKTENTEKTEDTQQTKPAAEDDTVAKVEECEGEVYDPNCPVLYINKVDPQSIACMMLLSEAGIKVNIKHVDLFKDEHKQDYFLNINPEHCVPTLVDGDFVLWESRPLMKYLCQKYVPESSFYPSDIKQRALVDRLMYWEASTLCTAVLDYAAYAAFLGKAIDSEKEPKVKEALDYLDKHLSDKSYVCGDTMTLVDLSIINTLALLWYIDYKIDSWSNVVQWVKRVEKIECFEKVNAAVADYKKTLENKAQ